MSSENNMLLDEQMAKLREHTQSAKMRCENIERMGLGDCSEVDDVYGEICELEVNLTEIKRAHDQIACIRFSYR